MLQELKGKGQVVSVDPKTDAEASSVFCKLEACKQAKIVLCVLPKEFCVRRSGKDPIIQGCYYFDE